MSEIKVEVTPFVSISLELIAELSCEGYPIEITETGAKVYNVDLTRIRKLEKEIQRYIDSYVNDLRIGNVVYKDGRFYTTKDEIDQVILNLKVTIPNNPDAATYICKVPTKMKYWTGKRLEINNIMSLSELVSYLRKLNLKPYCVSIYDNVYECPAYFPNMERKADCDNIIVVSNIPSDFARFISERELKPVYIVPDPLLFCRKYEPYALPLTEYVEGHKNYIYARAIEEAVTQYSFQLHKHKKRFIRVISYDGKEISFEINGTGLYTVANLSEYSVESAVNRILSFLSKRKIFPGDVAYYCYPIRLPSVNEYKLLDLLYKLEKLNEEGKNCQPISKL